MVVKLGTLKAVNCGVALLLCTPTDEKWSLNAFAIVYEIFVRFLSPHGVRRHVVCCFYSARRAEYWKYFTVRFDGIHVFGYNSAESEPIRMKFGALWEHCLPLALADHGRDPRRSESETARRSFVFFCEVNSARLYRFPVCQISRNLHTRRGSVSQWILSEQNFDNSP